MAQASVPVDTAFTLEKAASTLLVTHKLDRISLWRQPW
jgi:hypothetical protein